MFFLGMTYCRDYSRLHPDYCAKKIIVIKYFETGTTATHQSHGIIFPVHLFECPDSLGNICESSVQLYKFDALCGISSRVVELCPCT